MTLTEKILAEVARLVRPVEPDELSVSPHEAGKFVVSLRIEHRAGYLMKTDSGKGPLPENVHAGKSWDDVNAITQKQLDAARAGAAALLDAWAEAASDDYLCVLSPSDCLRPAVRIGLVERCGKCGGKAEVTCPTCEGDGKTTCPDCGGSGEKVCGTCGGSHETNCFYCSGRGFTEQQVQYMNASDRQRIPNQIHQSVARVPCDHCRGKGKQLCPDCWGRKFRCVRCWETGKIDCADCKAKGVLPCDGCDATGATHRTAWIDCTTGRAVSVGVSSDCDEDQETFLERVPLEQFGSLTSSTGGVALEKRNRANGSEIVFEYLAFIPLHTAGVVLGKERFVIRAYGPDCTVYHYHGLVGKLLEQDLAALEEALKQNASRLTLAVRRFLDSELNVQIVEGTATRAAATTGRANEMVDEQYLARAVAGVSRPLARLQSGFLRPAAILVTLVSTVFFSLSRHGVLIVGPIIQRLGILAIATVVMWFGVELAGRRRLKRLLGNVRGERLEGTFRKRRRRYRMWCAAGFVVAWYVSMIAMGYELHVRYHYFFSFRPVDTASFWMPMQ